MGRKYNKIKKNGETVGKYNKEIITYNGGNNWADKYKSKNKARQRIQNTNINRPSEFVGK